MVSRDKEKVLEFAFNKYINSTYYTDEELIKRVQVFIEKYFSIDITLEDITLYKRNKTASEIVHEVLPSQEVTSSLKPTLNLFNGITLIKLPTRGLTTTEIIGKYYNGEMPKTDPNLLFPLENTCWKYLIHNPNKYLTKLEYIPCGKDFYTTFISLSSILNNDFGKTYSRHKLYTMLRTYLHRCPEKDVISIRLPKNNFLRGVFDNIGHYILFLDEYPKEFQSYLEGNLSLEKLLIRVSNNYTGEYAPTPYALFNISYEEYHKLTTKPLFKIADKPEGGKTLLPEVIDKPCKIVTNILQDVEVRPIAKDATPHYCENLERVQELVSYIELNKAMPKVGEPLNKVMRSLTTSINNKKADHNSHLKKEYLQACTDAGIYVKPTQDVWRTYVNYMEIHNKYPTREKSANLVRDIKALALSKGIRIYRLEDYEVVKLYISKVETLSKFPTSLKLPDYIIYEILDKLVDEGYLVKSNVTPTRGRSLQQYTKVSTLEIPDRSIEPVVEVLPHPNKISLITKILNYLFKKKVW